MYTSSIILISRTSIRNKDKNVDNSVKLEYSDLFTRNIIPIRYPGKGTFLLRVLDKLAKMDLASQTRTVVEAIEANSKSNIKKLLVHHNGAKGLVFNNLEVAHALSGQNLEIVRLLLLYGLPLFPLCKFLSHVNFFKTLL
jgi:hypothetical protein